MRFVTDHHQSAAFAREPRPESLKVIGAGLPRCATSSLQAALESEHIGLRPCLHMANLVPHPARLEAACDAMLERDRARRHKLLHRVFDGFAATVDYPGSWFVLDLMDLYPDAVVVLNTRRGGFDAWLQSLSSLFFLGSLRYRLSCLLWRSDRAFYRWATQLGWVERPELGGGPDSTVTAPGMYDAHNEFVRTEARRRGMPLLEWQVQDGWAPLCKFLGKPVPPADVPFPHTNERAETARVWRYLMIRGILSWLLLFACVVLGGWFGPDLMMLAWAKLNGAIG